MLDISHTVKKKSESMNGKMAGRELGVGSFRRGGAGGGVCCSSLLKSNVKIFDIYTEESEYIQAAKTGG